MQSKSYYVYILSNQNRTCLYLGVTSDLSQRLWIHQQGIVKSSFCARYQVNQLIYYEFYTDPVQAIKREKEIKAWRREKKEALIETLNPYWREIELDHLF